MFKLNDSNSLEARPSRKPSRNRLRSSLQLLTMLSVLGQNPSIAEPAPTTASSTIVLNVIEKSDNAEVLAAYLSANAKILTDADKTAGFLKWQSLKLAELDKMLENKTGDEIKIIIAKPENQWTQKEPFRAKVVAYYKKSIDMAKGADAKGADAKGADAKGAEPKKEPQKPAEFGQEPIKKKTLPVKGIFNDKNGWHSNGILPKKAKVTDEEESSTLEFIETPTIFANFTTIIQRDVRGLSELKISFPFELENGGGGEYITVEISEITDFKKMEFGNPQLYFKGESKRSGAAEIAHKGTGPLRLRIVVNGMPTSTDKKPKTTDLKLKVGKLSISEQKIKK